MQKIARTGTAIRALRTFAVAFSLALAAAPTWAQTETGRLAGVVTDSSASVLPGATVALRSDKVTRSAVTDTAGIYAFASLPPGPYVVTVELAGFGTKQYKTAVTVGASVTLNARLEIGAQAEVITVVADEGIRPNIQSQDIATTVGEQQIRELPTITRNPYDLVRSRATPSTAWWRQRRRLFGRGAPEGSTSTARGRRA